MKKFYQVLLCRIVLMMTVFSFFACNSVIKEDEETENMDKSLTVLSWNVQALFDGEDQGSEYDDYRVSKAWSQEKYEARLNSIAKGLAAIPEKPDVIGFIEIENAGILEEMVSSVLANQGYNWTFFSRNPDGALGIGIMSKYPFTKAQSHSIISDGEINPRPMAEVCIDVGGEPVVLFVCHWKSKLGDPEVTEAQRKASARLALRRIKELETENPGIPIIIMGDLNENHDEFYRSGASFITALLPDDEKAASLVKNTFGEDSAHHNFLVVTDKKTQEAKYLNVPHNLFYTPWENELQKGSYVYRENWETIDHFLLRPSLYDNSGWDLASCQTVNIPPFTTQAGNPAAYNPRTGWGLSDHLPLLMTMKLNDGN
ncbi:MAG: endonuclease/exonuclease/phosphatase family protein [Treponema sp.]|jgi:endonuclease/exonuclease/phosphatase family metal-dependent hydrolase|nr:endonuclease/exonuclease/phosphatase family protein [Treponema sp.]